MISSGAGLNDETRERRRKKTVGRKYVDGRVVVGSHLSLEKREGWGIRLRGFAVSNLIRGLCLVRFPASLRDSSGCWGTAYPTLKRGANERCAYGAGGREGLSGWDLWHPRFWMQDLGSLASVISSGAGLSDETREQRRKETGGRKCTDG